MNKRRKIALSILTLGLIGSGVIASIAWFQKGTNSFGADISGSIVEEYFHCGNGTESDPFVITRPVHYYHLTEFFQRKTVLTVGGVTSHFGTDYLYFKVGYPLVENDASLYVYEYDNTGTYTGTPGSPRYSKTLNMSYFSGSNALMPIGTNEVPFFGSFNGGASSVAANGITIANLNIKTSDTVLVNDVPTNRSTSDAGVFGYVADQKDAENKTVIKDAYFDNLTIDLSGASNSTSDAGHISTHANNEIYVGYIVGHLHTYTRYDGTGPANASPIYNVYVNNAKIEGGAGSRSHFGYVGFADTINGVPGGEIDIAEIINDLNQAASGGPGSDPGEGGSVSAKSYMNWFYDGPRDGGAALIQGEIVSGICTENHITKSNQYEAHYTVAQTGIDPDDKYLFFARNSNTNIFKFSASTGVYINGANSYNFTWTTNTQGSYAAQYINYKITFTRSVPIGSGSYSTIYLNHTDTSSSSLFIYSSASGSGKSGRIVSTTYAHILNNVYRLKDNANGLSGDIHSSYVPLQFSDEIRTSVASKNTGYIVGTSLPTKKDTASVNASPKFGTYGINFVSNSLGTTTYTTNQITYQGLGVSEYNDSQVELITYSTSADKWVTIKDTHNNNYYGGATTPKNSNISSKINTLMTPEELGFKKYEAYGTIVETEAAPLTRNSLKNILSTTTAGVTTTNYQMAGIHFDMVETTSGTKYGVVSNDSSKKITIPRAYLNGVPEGDSSDYELLKGAINFSFPDKGYVNFVAGTYNSDSSKMCDFFSLFRVKRNSTNRNIIDAIYEIVGVYNNPDSDKYAYKVYSINSDGVHTGSAFYIDENDQTIADASSLTLLYDVEKSLKCNGSSAPVNNALYYFEVPINPGDYAMGLVVDSSYAGAYMLYLDIGANGELVEQDYNTEHKISGNPIFTQIEFISNGYVINSCFNIAYVVPAGATKETFWVKVSRTGTVFAVEVYNTTGNPFTMYVLLVDNNSDPDDEYPYTYTLKYNTGAVSSPYGSSGGYTGTSGGTQLAPLLT